jgi:hypothetical protein
MKLLLPTLALFAIAVLAHGQGTIGFNNGASSRVTICTVGREFRYVTAADNLHMGIFVGPSEFTLRMMPETPLGLIQPGNADGIFTVPGGTIYSISGFDAGTSPFAQVRVWSISHGLDWEAAMMDPGALYGQTDIRQLNPLGPSAGPGTVIWQSAVGTNPNRFRPVVIYNYFCIPEPSALALVAFCSVMLGIHRWRSSARK